MPSSLSTPKRKLICLTGFMGCGKTTIGRHLAGQLGWRFVDLDTRIEEHTGLRITEIFDHLGESAFREMEHDRLLHALGEAAALDAPAVLALGGGTFAQPQNIALLRTYGAAVVWLVCPIELLLERCVRKTNRPLFRDEASFRQLYEQRRPFYEQAHHRVQNNDEPSRVVEQILALGIPLCAEAPAPSVSATEKDDAGGAKA